MIRRVISAVSCGSVNNINSAIPRISLAPTNLGIIKGTTVLNRNSPETAKRGLSGDGL